MTTIAFTGYRPPKLGGYQTPNPIYDYVYQELEQLFIQLKPDKCISGMAQGFDLMAAELTLKLKIELVAAVPFQGQELYWPVDITKKYRSILKQAGMTIFCSSGEYAAHKYQIRNEWMVNHCDILLACINANETSGGTFNCVEYAKSQKKPIYYIHPESAK